jgi:hypothetical protein
MIETVVWDIEKGWFAILAGICMDANFDLYRHYTPQVSFTGVQLLLHSVTPNLVELC